MPPTPASSRRPTQTSKSTDLVPVGPREVIASKKAHWASKRDEYGNKPTTVKALILRNGRNGAMGTGELVSSKIRMAGREKLDLLAEDMMARYATAIAAPFDSLKCQKIAESYFMSWLDEIENLQDPDLFMEKTMSETLSRYPPIQPKNKKEKPENPLNNPVKVATVVSSRIHNAYLLASGWRLAGSFLMQLRDNLRDDKQIKLMLQQNDGLRKQYLVLYDLVNIIVDVNQQRFAQLATTAPHWKQYFQPNQYKEAGDDQPEFVFSWEQVKQVHKSFLDSIVVELCLPASPYPKQILIGLLSEAIEETPKDSKRFPQALWDAMGDLSYSVEVLDLLSTPLLGPEGETWKAEPREKADEYLDWEDAQLFSLEAGKEINTFKDLLVPLSKTKDRAVLETIWKYINLNYQGASGKTLDELWNLDDRKDRFATWHAIYTPKTGQKSDNTDDPDGPPALVPFSGNGKKGGPSGSKKPLAITSGYDSDDSMPSLQTVSDSSDEDIDFESDEDDSEDEYETDEDESDYDEELEEEFRDWYREAMDIAQADPDFHNPRREAKDFEDMASYKQDNPFIKLLGSLRGRLFSGSAAMKTTDRTQPRRPYNGPKPPLSAYKPVPSQKPTPKPTTKPASKSQPKTHAATVEEVSDEDEPTTPAKKKKKKPKKKKKKAAGPTTEEPILEEIAPESEPEPEPAPAPTPSASRKKTPAKQAPKAPSVKSAPSAVPGPFGSTASLPIIGEQTAQSARTYLKSEGLDSEKSKIKTRADHATLFASGEKPEKKAGIFSRFVKEKSKTEVDEAGKYSFLSRLSKKAKSAMHQLLNTAEDDRRGLAPMKWEQFVKVMTEMGFSVDSSTAGSSVRFDPPDPRDHPITFHRPHPDSTIPPTMLRDFGKRLKRTYGWNDDDFLKKIS